MNQSQLGGNGVAGVDAGGVGLRKSTLISDLRKGRFGSRKDLECCGID